MKIIRLTTLLDFGGQERKYILFVQDGKNVLKNEYIFAALGYGGYAERYIKEQGFEVKIFNSKPSIYNLKNIWMLYKWFKLIKPDLVHTAAAEANFHGIIAAKLANVKVILAEEIGFPNHSKKAKLVFKIIYRFANKVLCVSEAVKKYLIKIGELNPKKGIVIYNPATIQQKNLNKNLAEQFTIVCVGRLEVVKNQQLLIHCLSKIKDQNSRLILVGDGNERNNLEALITQLNLNHRVTITGFTNTPEHFLAQGHLFVLPSLSEGFGIAVVEAMLVGVPCLCSNVGGISEFIIDNETGWLFNPKNEVELINSLDKIISTDYKLIKAKGQKGKESITNRFTIQKYQSSLENLYQELS